MHYFSHNVIHIHTPPGCSGSEAVPELKAATRTKTIFLVIPRCPQASVFAMVRKTKTQKAKKTKKKEQAGATAGITQTRRCSARLEKQRADERFDQLAKMVSDEEVDKETPVSDETKESDEETDEKEKEEKNEGDEGGDGVPLTQMSQVPVEGDEGGGVPLTQMYVTGDVDESDDRPLTQVESTTNMSDDNDIGADIRAPSKPRLTPLMRLNPNPSQIASGQLKLPEEAASAQSSEEAASAQSSSTTVATAGRTDLVRPVRKSKKLARAKNKK